MLRAHFGSLTLEGTTYVHEAAAVVGDEGGCAGLMDVANLFVEDGGGYLGELDGKQATEAAAGVGLGHLLEFDSTGVLDQRSWFLGYTKLTKEVARVMIGDEACGHATNVGDAEDVDDEVAELVGLFANGGGTLEHVWVVGEEFGVVDLDHRRARTGGCDDVVVGLKRLDEVACDISGFLTVAAVEADLPAAGLGFGE